MFKNENKIKIKHSNTNYINFWDNLIYIRCKKYSDNSKIEIDDRPRLTTFLILYNVQACLLITSRILPHIKLQYNKQANSIKMELRVGT